MRDAIRKSGGYAHAPKHEVYADVLHDLHGGDAELYARHLAQAGDVKAEFARLSNDRAAAWDVLMDEGRRR